jgi:hypothetical protein
LETAEKKRTSAAKQVAEKLTAQKVVHPQVNAICK